MTADLAAALARRVKGEVRFDAGSRALYATDASNYRQVPIGVVLPRDVADVVAAMDVCRQFDVPVLPRGAGTSLAGQCCNVAVVIDASKYLNRVLEIDPVRRLARVEPGVILDDLRSAAEAHGLTFGPDPATHNRCTLGGMIGNNSCGAHSMMAEMYGHGALTAENIEELDVLLYDGSRLRLGPGEGPDRLAVAGSGRAADIARGLRDLAAEYGDLIRREFPDIPRRVSGFNLPALLPEHGASAAQAIAGSEGTCAFVLEATVRLMPAQPARELLVLGYPDVYAAADDVPRIRAWRPVALEGMDDRLMADAMRVGICPDMHRLLPKGGGWLLVEFGGDTPEEAKARASAAAAEVSGWPDAPSLSWPRGCDVDDIWRLRESGLAAAARVGEDERPTWEGWEDSAVPPERLGDYLRGLRALMEAYGYYGNFYGHFGQGCVHTRIDFDLVTEAGIRDFRRFVTDAADLTVRLGGSLSGEHGDGQSRGELLTRMFSPAMMDAFRAFKRLWDPAGRMNPGKLIDARPLDHDLRLGTSYHPPALDTEFSFAADGRRFSTSTLRCVGVGACRRLDHGTMCPSFMATREERHSTRGRARLLFEMLQGDPLHGPWNEPHVKEALDLCLACKGCKKDCPVSVDMATYKAEFLSHYYKAHARPRSAYAFGFAHKWARLTSAVPGLPRLANLAANVPGLNGAAKWMTGMAPARAIPAFAPQPFRRWFDRRRAPASSPSGRRVLLWVDTFAEHFSPEVARAAVQVLEHAGWQVALQPAGLCCGRPLYDYGFLDAARRTLEQIMTSLREELDAGTPIVGLEPSCVSVFRDELRNLFPDDPRARALAGRVSLLTEFLATQDTPGPRSQPGRRALLHLHCHHKAVLDSRADASVLEAAGVDLEVLDAGCCGMAGSFGFEHDHYDVSMRIGERALLPAVRRAADDMLIVADGFSCREQIRQATGRRAVHPAEVLALGL